MLTIARLFGKSPFAPLQTHLDLIASCISALPGIFDAWLHGKPSDAVQKISDLEREADLVAESIRAHLPKSLFLPVDRTALLEILSVHQQIATQAEVIAFHTTVDGMKIPAVLEGKFQQLVQHNIEIFWRAHAVVKELDGLLESAFGGLEAKKVHGMIEQIPFLEHDANTELWAVKKLLYTADVSHQTFHWIIRFIEAIRGLSRLSEQLSERIRSLLELK